LSKTVAFRARSGADDARRNGARPLLPRGRVQQVESADKRRGRGLQDLRDGLRHGDALPGPQRTQWPRADPLQLGRRHVRKRLPGQERPLLGPEDAGLRQYDHPGHRARK
jgi:hypothetical protein